MCTTVLTMKSRRVQDVPRFIGGVKQLSMLAVDVANNIGTKMVGIFGPHVVGTRVSKVDVQSQYVAELCGLQNVVKLARN